MSIKDLDDETIKQITFTILPGGKSIFHVGYNNTEEMEFICQKGLIDKNDVSSLKYSFPYFNDLDGNCPFHLCVQKEQYKTLNMLLKYLSGQGIDHHSRLIYRYMPLMLEKELTNFITYVDSRNQETELTKQFTRMQINENKKTPGIVPSDFFDSKAVVESALFDTNSQKG